MSSRYASRLWRDRHDDRGIAMVMVMGTMLVLSLVVVAGLTYVTNAMPQVRHSQDYQIAGSAAQAGVDDYLSRLAVCDTYWRAACTNSDPDNTNGGASWVSVPDTSSGALSTGQYTYKLIPGANSGRIRLQVKGRSPAAKCNAGVSGCVTRTLTVDLNKPGLLNYIYYTDLETFDPLLYPLFTANFASYKASCTTSRPCTSSDGATSSSSPSGCTKSSSSNSSSKPCIITTTTPSYSTYYTYDTVATDLGDIRDNCGAQADGSDEQYYYGPASGGRKGASWGYTYTPYTTTTTTTKVDKYTSKNGSEASGYPTTSNSSAGPTAGSQGSSSVPCSLTAIQFAAGDTINGPLWSNDALDVNGSIFNGKTNTAWNTSAPIQPTSTDDWFWGSGPGDGSNQPISQSAPITMPSTNAAIEQQADPAYAGQGCLYTGPTRFQFESNGKYLVTSPYSTNLPSYCGANKTATAQEVSGPKNGVIYVQSIPTSGKYNIACNEANVYSDLTYPNPNDLNAANISCTDGTAYVSGSGFSGAYTLAAAKDIYVVNNLTYNSKSSSSSTVMGLVANGFIYVYHPVDSSGNQLSGINNIEIDAAILSVDDSFTVQNFQYGSQLGTLTVFGGIYQRYRGPVGQGNGTCTGNGSTGYCKSYNYDSRLPVTPPPYFLDPVNAAWQVAEESE